jgi:hypothetical protein
MQWKSPNQKLSRMCFPVFLCNKFDAFYHDRQFSLLGNVALFLFYFFICKGMANISLCGE